MSRVKSVFAENIEYSQFKTPYTGIATMVLAQAISDLKYLGDDEHGIYNGTVVAKEEVLRFFNSKWAEFLAVSAGMDQTEFERLRGKFA